MKYLIGFLIVLSPLFSFGFSIYDLDETATDSLNALMPSETVGVTSCILRYEFDIEEKKSTNEFKYSLKVKLMKNRTIKRSRNVYTGKYPMNLYETVKVYLEDHVERMKEDHSDKFCTQNNVLSKPARTTARGGERTKVHGGAR